MTDSQIHIVPASDLSNMLTHHSWYMNDYQGQVQTAYENIYPISSTFPMNTPSAQITFQIPTGSYAIAIKQSHLEYTMAMTYHFKPAAGTVCTAWLENGIWWQQDYTVQAGTVGANLQPIPVESTAARPQPYAVNTGPLNAMVPFLESDMNYGSAKCHTYRIFDKTNYYQAKVSTNASSKEQATWFMTDSVYDSEQDQGDHAIFFDGRPWVQSGTSARAYLGTTNWVNGTTCTVGTGIDASFSLGPKDAYTTDYAVTIFKQFKVPIAYLSDLFMQDSPLFYANAVNLSWITLQLKFQQYNLANIFGNGQTGLCSSWVNPTGTAYNGYGLVQSTSQLTNTGDNPQISPLLTNPSVGNLGCAITNMKLLLYTKSSNVFTSDLQSTEILAEKIQVCTWSSLQQIYSHGGYNFTINQSNKNVQDMCFTFAPNDQGVSDSVAIHGLSTLYAASEIIAITNGRFQNFASCFPYNFQMQIPYQGSTKNLINGIAGIQSIQQYKDMSLGALRILNNPFYGPNAMWGDNEYKMFQNMIIMNVEQFKGDLLGDDCIQDGLDTRGRGPIVKWDYIAKYDPNSIYANGASAPEQAGWGTNNGYQTLGYANGSNVGIQANCYYFTEQFNIIQPQSNKMQITEDIEKYLPQQGPPM